MNSDDAKRIIENTKIRVPGALEDVMKLELYNVVRDFLDGTDAWQEDIPVHVQADRKTYYLSASGEVARLKSLVDSNGLPVRGTMAEPGVLILERAPSKTDTYTATVSILPNGVNSDGFPDMPDWISSKYYMTLVDGLLARMLSHPAKPYANAALAAVHNSRFESGVGVASAHVQHANLASAQAWRFPRGFIAPSRR